MIVSTVVPITNSGGRKWSIKFKVLCWHMLWRTVENQRTQSG